MEKFGKRLRNWRTDKSLSQQVIAKKLNTYHFIIGRYEWVDMNSLEEEAKKLAELLETTLGYLLGEVKQTDTFENAIMLKRLQQINGLPEGKYCIL